MRKGKDFIKPVIVSYDCFHLDPIEEWIPEDPYDVDFWMNFTIGPNESSGDNFDVRIVTPNNLRGKDSDKYAIVLKEYSLQLVLETVNKMLEDIQALDWVHVTDELSKKMHWEYQDYKP